MFRRSLFVFVVLLGTVSTQFNFHNGFPSTFFSLDEDAQMRGFQQKMLKEFETLKERVSRLEKMVAALESSAHESWNSSDSGSLYKLFDERKSWDEAEAHCQSMNAHLAVIDNGAKNAFVKELLAENRTAEYAWIGMKTRTTAAASTFTNFAAESPIDGLAVIDKSGTWSIRSCVQLRPYICQIVKL